MVAIASEATSQAATAVELGASHAADVAHAVEPWYMSPDVWVLVAFILFFAVIGRTAYRFVTTALDDRADRIRNQIDEATRLAAEAQDLLASYERKQREAAQEAEAIQDAARREAERLAEQASKDLRAALERREQLAMERIAQAEQTAAAEVRAMAIDLAMTATERVLSGTVGAKHADALVDAAIADIPDKLRIN